MRLQIASTVIHWNSYAMNNNVLIRKPIFLWAILAATACLYLMLGYHTVRQNFFQLALIFAALFGFYFIGMKYFAKAYFVHLFAAGIFFRLLFLFSVPNLSDDVYRFIWDGRVAANGINPFAFLPSEIIRMPALEGINENLFQKLNSPDYYSIYPPVLQGIFWLTAALFPESILASMFFMKAVIFLIDIGTCFLIIAILKKLALPKERALFYILNPLVIAELTGNIHFDGVMIFCLMLAFYLLLSNNWKSSAIFLGAGIATKLIPILFIPLVIFKLGWKKGLSYAMIAGLVTLILFALVFDASTIQHMINSAGLFVQTFEFNASVYYLFRWIGSLIMGYNTIAILGPLLYMVAGLLILFVSWNSKKTSATSFFDKALFIVTLWFLFATTVHPWYICLPVALSVFTKFRFAIIWSYTTTLSYAAYQFSPVKENIWLIALGYMVVISCLLLEIKKSEVKSISTF